MTRRTRVGAAAGAGVVAAAVLVGVAVGPGHDGTTAAARSAPVSTGEVRRGRLTAAVSQDGILTYRARADGSPYRVIDRARGTYTGLPETGDEVPCGGVLYRVDDRPVLLLCGPVPAFRDLGRGTAGRDVRQLNRNLHALGLDAGPHAAIAPGDGRFTARTARALRALQRRRGLPATGALAADGAVFLPEPARIARVTAELGGPARPGAPVLDATSGTLHVQVNLDPSQQGEVKRGDRARVTLPGDTVVAGTVTGFGRIAVAPAGPDSTAADATVPTSIALDDPGRARGLDRAPVQVDITTAGVADALSVPVTALVGRAGGGFAVEVARADGRRVPVAVRLGLFDTGGGRVQVDGALRDGDRVVVAAP